MASLRTMIVDASARRLLILAVLCVACAFGGGSFRPNAPTLLMIRPVLVVAFVALAVAPATYDWRRLRVPALLLVGLAIIMIVQLIPIPVSWWLGFAGRARYAPAVLASGVSALPLSLVPDLTINSLLSLLPATCILLGYGGMRPEHRWATIWLAIGLAGSSVLMALLQLGGHGGIGYIYGARQDYVGGILANRNHQAVMLAGTLPLLAVAARFIILRGRHRIAIAALSGIAVVILPIILLTGSRQGLLLTLPAILAAVLLAPRPASLSGRRFFGRIPISGRWMVVGLLVVAVILFGLAIATGRAVSIERLTAVDAVANDARWRNLPTVIAITQDMLPWGTGFGTFDPVYRGFEPDALLHASYFNHAHNDFLETVMTGGVPAVLVITVLLGHIAWRFIAIAGSDRQTSIDSLYLDRAAAILVMMFMAASIIDYPLRTSIGSMFAALALCWLSSPPIPPTQSGKRRSSKYPHSGRTGMRP